MAGASIDHLVSVIIFMSAIILFIGMFSQTVQTGVEYQLHRAVASKCSDLLDNMLLSPGIPSGWGKTSDAPVGFGLQAEEFTQYHLSPFSLMRLCSSTGTPVTYSMTGQTYSNITMGFGQSLLVPYDEALDSSTVSRLLGVNGSYGFSLTLTPTVKLAISQTQANPLNLLISSYGSGFPLANAQVDYCLITVFGQGAGSFPTYDVKYGTAVTDSAGSSSVSFPGIDGNSVSYALIASAHLSGLVGVGYYSHVLYDTSYVVPLIGSTANGTAIIAHSWDVNEQGDPDAVLYYNATFVILTEDFSPRQIPYSNATGSAVGLLTSQNPEHAYDLLTMSTNNPGILVIAYSKNATASGVVVMPWGLSSLGFPITFGGNPDAMSWVATDLRQVMVNGIAYQAKLSVWIINGYQVNG